MVFETARLAVREFTAEDWRAFHAYSVDSAIVRAWSGPVTEQTTRETIRSAIEQRRRPDPNCHHLAIVERSSGILIGDVDISGMAGEPEVELGVLIAAGSRGRGYGAEVARGASDWALTSLAMKRVVAYCEPENTASRGMLERAGFTYERMWHRAPDDPGGAGKWPRACVYVRPAPGTTA